MSGRSLLSVIVACPLWAAGCSSLFHHETDQTAKAEKNEQRQREAKPMPTPRINANTYLAAGQMLEKQGDLAGAIAQYERAISTQPRCVQAYNRLGTLYQKQRRYAEAEQIFKTGVEADSGSAMLLNNLGYIFLVQQRFDDAETAFREALKVAPDFKRARMNLGIALTQRGQLSKGVLEFREVVPPDVAYFNVAVICIRRGDYSNAEASLRQALEINPDCPGAREQLDHVTRMAKGRHDNKPEPAATVTEPLAGGTEDEPARAP